MNDGLKFFLKKAGLIVLCTLLIIVFYFSFYRPLYGRYIEESYKRIELRLSK